MQTIVPRLRSLLFVPAHVERFVSRAGDRGADAIILDLEDAVPDDRKEQARASLPASIARLRAAAMAMVRVNHGLLDLARDLEAAVMPGLGALVLPKVEDAAFVREIADAVARLEAQRGMPNGTVRFVLQIETPAALPHLPAIAASHARIVALSLGPEDFCASLGAEPCDDVLLGPNLAVLCAARAAGVLPLGFVGSIGGYADPAAFRATVTHARRLGFRGAMAIHPAQVAILNDGFAPTGTEIEWARRVAAAERDASIAGKGAFTIDGKMIDAPVIRRAREILANAGSPSPGGAGAELPD